MLYIFVLASTISADGYSSDTARVGAMGGTIRLDANKVCYSLPYVKEPLNWWNGLGLWLIKAGWCFSVLMLYLTIKRKYYETSS